MNIGAFIICVGFLVLAILDITGKQFHINKRYRGNTAVREWQKKRVFADVVSCVGALILFLSHEWKIGLFFIGAVVLLIGLVLLFLIDRNFKKNID